jgi:hypothetical protein
MWFQHPRIGHLSVVLARKGPGPGQPVDPDTVMIRARLAQHLENLQRAAPALKGFKIVESANADYRYRLIVPKAAFADAMRDILLAIGWTNVKADAQAHAGAVGQGFVDALHDTWAAFQRIQPR